jgi:hypothetical protein
MRGQELDVAHSAVASMQFSTSQKRSQPGPKREKHYSYDESIDEAAQLLEDEPVDIEQAIPAEENEPVEHVEEAEESSAVFDEGPPNRVEPHE